MQREGSARLEEAKRVVDFPEQVGGLARAGGKTGDEAGQQRSGASGRARLSTHTPLPDPIHGYTALRRAPRRKSSIPVGPLRIISVTLVYLAEIHCKYGRRQRRTGCRRGAPRGRL